LDYQILSNTLYDLLESTIVDLAKKVSSLSISKISITLRLHKQDN
jgi:hypothetical protein